MVFNSPWALDVPSFILGVIVSGYLGWVLQQIRLQRGPMGAPNRPMSVPTKGTPEGVRQAARAALWRFLGWWFVMICSIGVLAGVCYLMFLFSMK
jgi:hypothetical protein